MLRYHRSDCWLAAQVCSHLFSFAHPCPAVGSLARPMNDETEHDALVNPDSPASNAGTLTPPTQPRKAPSNDLSEVSEEMINDDQRPMTSDEAVTRAIDEIGFGRFHALLLVAVGIVFGAEAAMIFLATFIQKAVEQEFNVSQTIEGTLATTFFFGMFLGSFVFGWWSDHGGRRRVAIVSVLVAVIGGCLGAAAQAFWMLSVGFGITGFGVGGGFVVPALFMELLPTRSRELWMAVAYSMFSIGVIIQCFYAWMLQDQSWRWVSVCTTAPLALVFFFSWMIPESPHYLLGINDREGAHSFICRVSRVCGKPVPRCALAILAPTKGRSSPASPVGSPLNDNLKGLRKYARMFDKEYRTLTLSLFVIWGGASCCYYGIIMVTTEVFLKSGSFASIAIAASGELPAYPLIGWSTKNLGRKFPLRALPTCTAAFLICFYLVKQPTNAPAGSSPGYYFEVVFAFLTRLCILLAFDIAYMYSPEAFPTEIRTTATGSCSGLARIVSMLTPFIAYPLQQASPIAPYIVFAGILLLMSLGASQLPFDTKGKSMGDSDAPSALDDSARHEVKMITEHEREL